MAPNEPNLPEAATPPEPADEPTDGQHPTQPSPGVTPGDQVESAQPAPADPPVGGPPLQSPAAPHEAVQPTEGLGSRTPDETVDGQPAVQQGQETGPAPGPSPDAGGATQP